MTSALLAGASAWSLTPPSESSERPSSSPRRRRRASSAVSGAICFGRTFRGDRLEFGCCADCGRASWRASLLLGVDVTTVRCLEDGSFDPLQCVAGKCVCVDADSGELDPEGKVVDVNELVDGSLPCCESFRRRPCPPPPRGPDAVLLQLTSAATRSVATSFPARESVARR